MLTRQLPPSSEGEVHSFSRQAIDLLQYQTGRRYRGEFRLERRQAARDQIGVYEVNYSRVFGYIPSRKRSLAGTVWACNQDAPRSSPGLRHVASIYERSANRP